MRRGAHLSGAQPRARATTLAASALLAAVLALSLGGVALGAPGDTEDFARRVASAQELAVSSTEIVATAEDAADLAESIEELLPASETVQAAGGAIEVDQSTLYGHLTRMRTARSPEARREAARDVAEHLTSLRLAVGEGGGAAIVTDPALLDELSQGGARPSGLREMLERIEEWLRRLVESLTPDAPEGATTVVQVVLWLLAGAVVLLIAWLARRYWLARAERVPDAEGDGVAEPAVAAARDLPEDALAYAERMAAQGSYREAVRALFGDAARALVRAGAVRQTKTLTNAELLAQAKTSRPAVGIPLGELSAGFEVAWYGHEDPGADGFRRARDLHGDVVGLSGGGLP